MMPKEKKRENIMNKNLINWNYRNNLRIKERVNCLRIKGYYPKDRIQEEEVH